MSSWIHQESQLRYNSRTKFPVYLCKETYHIYEWDSRCIKTSINPFIKLWFKATTEIYVWSRTQYKKIDINFFWRSFHLQGHMRYLYLKLSNSAFLNPSCMQDKQNTEIIRSGVPASCLCEHSQDFKIYIFTLIFNLFKSWTHLIKIGKVSKMRICLLFFFFFWHFLT